MSYKITATAKKRFKRWLFENDLSLTQFAKKCGCSRQYLSSILDGKKNATPSVIEKFKLGGYELI